MESIIIEDRSQLFCILEIYFGIQNTNKIISLKKNWYMWGKLYSEFETELNV